MTAFSPISAITQLTQLNRHAATIVVGAIAIFAAIAIITSLKVDIETSVLVALYLVGMGALLVILSNIINDTISKYIIGYTITICFCLITICFVVSALFRDQGFVNPPYCLVRFWEKCDVIEDRITDSNSLTIDATTNIPPVIATDNTQVQPANYKVFIQFAGLITRESIKDLNKALKAGQWKVQSDSGERTRAAAGFNEIRYKSESDKAAAQALADAITEARIAAATVVIKQVSAIRPGELEVWISN